MEYLLKVTAVVTIFYIIYKLFLQRDTFFESNRWFLIIGLISSLVIPFLVIPIYIEYTPVSFDNLLINEKLSTEIAEKPFNILDYLPIIYGIGVVFFFGRFLIQFISLIKIIHKNKGIKKDGFVFIETQSNTSPFSFFKWIVYNPETFSPTELEHIIEHEKTHAKQYHSIDILITQLFCVLLWFNPFMWLYNKDLKQNLEFIADKRTLNQYNCKKSYQYTLLKTSMPSHQMALSNHFYNSLIKKRIVMLHKSKSKKINQLKYALVFPALLGFLISCNSKEIENSETTEPLLLSIDKAQQPFIIVDGKVMTQEAFEKLDPANFIAVNVIKDEHAVKKYGDKGINGVLEINTKGEAKIIEGKQSNIKVTGYKIKSDTTSQNITIRGISTANGGFPLFIVNGKESSQEEFSKITAEDINTLDILKGETAAKKYGNKAKNGVVIITTKK